MKQFSPKARVCEDSHSPGGASLKTSSNDSASSGILSEKSRMSNRPSGPARALTVSEDSKRKQSTKLVYWTKLLPQEDIARQL